MSQRETEFAIREDGDGLYLEPSLLVPYGEQITGTPEFGSATEEFEMGAFRDHPTVVLLDVHNGRPISGRLPARESERGWMTDGGRLLNTEAARDFAASVREGVVGPSVEFDAQSSEKRRTKTGIAHTRVKRVGGVAATYRAAYSGSFAVRHMEVPTVAELQETPPEPTPVPPPTPAPAPEPAIRQADIAVVAQRITDDAIRSYAASQLLGGRGGAIDPFAEYRGLSFGDLAQRAMAPGAERETREWMSLALRTFADTVTTSGANAGMVTPGVVGDVHGIVSRGRPAITAFGGPRAIPDISGMSVDWPYYDGTLTAAVGAQSAEKAEITSVAMNIKKGTEALATYAGGSDVSFQLLRRSTKNYLDVYFRILLTAWGVVTDAAFVTELETGSVTADTGALGSLTAAAFKDFVIDASIAVETATGQPADFVLASTTAFTAMAKLFTPITTLTNTGVGTTDLRTLTVAVGGLPLIHVPSITAGKFIVSNREAAAWYEDGPFQVQDTDVIHLGQNVAIWSMGAGARFIPAGIIEVYDVP